jgi:DNA-binding CsgD family transcriptional regulator
MAGQRDIYQSAVSGSAAAMSLTARQAEVLQLAGRGLCGKQIAHHLGISVRTVEDHFSAMRQRTGTHSQSELIACAAAAGLVRPAFPFPESAVPGRRPRLPDQTAKPVPQTSPRTACRPTH